MTVTQPAPDMGAGSHRPWAGYWQLPEPLLAFDPIDAGQHAVNPLAGLADFGPYSASSNKDSPRSSVRVALLAPDADLPALRGLLRELWYPQQPRERTEYLPPYPGWRQAFGCRIEPAAARAQITLPGDLDTRIRDAASPALMLAAALSDGLRALKLVQDSFDVIVFYLPPRFAPCFSDGPFDLHDAVKATGQGLVCRRRSSPMRRCATGAGPASPGGWPPPCTRKPAGCRGNCTRRPGRWIRRPPISGCPTRCGRPQTGPLAS